MNNNQCYIIEIPYSGRTYSFMREEEARWFQSRRAVYPMIMGSQPNDGGNLFMTPEEHDEVLKREPSLAKFIRRVMGSEEFINNKMRYCFWLVDASPAEIKHSRILYERVSRVKEHRLASRAEATRKKADTPSLFSVIRQPTTEYLFIPRVSSERRGYIPMGYIPPEVIVTDAAFALPYATPYHLGILSSVVHMAWTRVVCGRLKSDYRYSSTVVYNNFVWPETDPYQVMKIERTGRAILEARANHPESSYADLYDEVSMPPDLRKAHQENDAAVKEVYGFPKDIDELGMVTHLMELHGKVSAMVDGKKSRKR